MCLLGKSCNQWLMHVFVHDMYTRVVETTQPNKKHSHISIVANFSKSLSLHLSRKTFPIGPNITKGQSGVTRVTTQSLACLQGQEKASSTSRRTCTQVIAFYKYIIVWQPKPYIPIPFKPHHHKLLSDKGNERGHQLRGLVFNLDLQQESLLYTVEI